MKTAARDFVTVDGCRLEYRWIGPPAREAPTIVFLHEGLGSITQWRDFPDELCARTGCGGLVYNRKGYGNSDPLVSLPVTFMHHEALDVLPRLLEEVDVEQPVLFGHSDGGSIALIYAGSRLGVPRALILEAPHVFVEPLTVASIAALAESYDSTPLRARLGRHHRNVDPLFDAWTRTWLSPEFRDWNIEPTLDRIACPTLVIQGRDDQYGTAKQVESIVKATAGQVDSLMLEQCGHSPHVDQREVVLDAAAAFLRRAAAAP